MSANTIRTTAAGISLCSFMVATRYSRRFTPDRDLIRITAKGPDMLLYPVHGSALVTEREIGISFRLFRMSDHSLFFFQSYLHWK